MPNWVFNYLTVEGSPDSVKKLKEQVSQPYVMPVQSHGDLSFRVEDKEVNEAFSFWNIIKPTDMEAYPKQPNFESDKPYAGNDWYSWNNRNWGVKWDTMESELVDEDMNGENLVLVYRFDTAWGIPDEALKKLSAQYPDLLFTLSYEEETGWGGEHEYLRGEQLEGSEYNWKCKECDYEEIDEPPYCEDCEYDMCPKCGYGEPVPEDQAQCPVHKELLNA